MQRSKSSTTLDLALLPLPLVTASVQKELPVQLVLLYRRQDFDLTISGLHHPDVDPEPLITDTIGLDELPERFEALKRPTTECKVLIEP